MDLSKLSDADLDALESGNLKLMSDVGLAEIERESAASAPPDYASVFSSNQDQPDKPYGFMEGVGKKVLKNVSNINANYEKLIPGLSTVNKLLRGGESWQDIARRQEYRPTSGWSSAIGDIVTMLPGSVAGGASIPMQMAIGGTAATAMQDKPTPASAIINYGMEGFGGGIGKLGGMAIGRAKNAMSGNKVLPADLQAMAILRAKMLAEGITPAQASRQLAPGMMLSEIGAPKGAIEATAGSLARRSPEAGQAVATIANQRRVERGPALMQRIANELTGGESPTAMQLERIAAARKLEAAPFYKDAYANSGPITIPPYLASRPSITKATDVLGNMALERGSNNLAPTNGTMTLEAADLLKRALDDVVYAGKMPTSGIGLNQLGDIKDTRRLFMESVDSQAPESYAKGRSIWSGAARDMDAAELGKQAWNQGPEYVADFLKNASKSERDMFRAAANAELVRQESKLGSNSEVFRRLMNSRNAQDVVQQLSAVDGPSGVPALVSRQMQQADFMNRLTGGSGTAERQAADDLFGQVSLPQQIIDKGITKTAYDNTVRKVVDLALTGKNTTASRLSPMMFSVDEAANRDLLRRMGLLDIDISKLAGPKAATGTGAIMLQGLIND